MRRTAATARRRQAARQYAAPVVSLPRRPGSHVQAPAVNGGHARRAALALAIATVLGGGAPARAIELQRAPFGRWSISGFTKGYAVFKTDPDSQRQRPTGIVDVEVTGEPHPKARLYLDTRTTFGGPPEHADGLGIYNVSDTFQNISPGVEIEQGYVDLYLPNVDLRIGKQKFAWGRLDSFQPTDVVNPQRFNDRFLSEEQDAKIGIPALQASFFAPPLGPAYPTDVRFTFIWVPVPVPFRFPLEEERWFPSSIALPGALVIPRGALGGGLPLATTTVGTVSRADNVRPPQQLDEGAVGLRLSGLYRGVDWSLYYYNGAETAPAFDYRTTIVSPSAHRKVSQGINPTSQDLEHLQSDSLLQPLFGRIQLAGGDAAFQLAGFTARAEAAYGVNRLLPRDVQDLLSFENVGRALGPGFGTLAPALLAGKRVPIDLGDVSVARDTVEWGAGIDYLYEGWMPLVQVNQTLVLDNATALLINDVESRLLFVLRKSFLAERLETELVTVQGLERGYTSGIARLTYAITDDLHVRLGYLLIAGSRRTVVGQYHDNDEGFLEVRYSY